MRAQLDAEALARFEREGRATALSHPNIVATSTSARTQGSPIS
jgi:hypothetical protein